MRVTYSKKDEREINAVEEKAAFIKSPVPLAHVRGMPSCA